MAGPAGEETAPGFGETLSPGAQRRENAFQSRYRVALNHRRQPVFEHLNNGDEERYLNRIGNFSKGLPHDANGEVEPAAYNKLLRATRSGRADHFEAVPLSGGRRLTNPQAGLAFDLEGADAQHFAIPPAPALASAQAAGEAVELYWMALLRDVNFSDYGGHPEVTAAATDLSSLEDFRGARRNGAVTAQTLFRDPLPGVLKGPYISQFLWLGTPYGAEYVERRIKTPVPGSDHLTRFSDWLEAQNGGAEAGATRFDPVRRYIRTGRDLAEWVHRDVLFQAYFNAALILGTPPDSSDEITGGGIGCPTNAGDPYHNSQNQIGFATFGDPHFKALLCEVATRALKATWFQKWLVHRRLRPEEYGGLVHQQVASNRYPGILHQDILTAAAIERVHGRHGAYLLPVAFSEGSPTHPSYSAGHATVAGACVTVLKALYDESFVIPQPVEPTPDGLALQPYQGPALTVGGELNKLASNIATGRNIAGVHWRSDARESLLLGEKIAISILRDQKGCYNEDFEGFRFTRFDGTSVTI
ncbi:MAG TPA: vanadium-dependent haloperoxidase [Thermoanaerobaculia bacterium]|nr:vanadium-dependent haloperoxidase [Thermoanaerobaculia bacterium]